MLDFVVIMLIIFYMVTLWKFAVKVGKPGWSLFIPIYSSFVWVDIAKMDSIWCLLSFAPRIVKYMYPGDVNISLLASIFSLIIHFCLYDSIAKRFGKDTGFSIGLLLLNPIFLAILTYSKKCYYYKGW